MTPPARWELSVPPTRQQLLETMQEWQVSPPLAQMILTRGLTRALLTPELTLSPNPALKEAARRLVRAMQCGLRIRIHGDYDADGVTATAVLVVGLRRLGANVHGFIPHRLQEGYGVHLSRVEEHSRESDVLVTVDCGVTNLEEVRALLSAGTEVIVTDHHAPGPDFPDCLVVHPHLTPAYQSEYHNLTGAGVAYHLLWAVCEELGQPQPLDLTALACVGTIADVAPLLGENRALVMAGLQELARTRLPGLRALLDDQKLRAPSARDVAFQVAPRLNAAGRMGEADRALELLTTESTHEAAALASYLEMRNQERRVLQDQMYDQALELVNPADPALVITHPDWHAGVMGIVASKLVDKFYKPVYIVAQGKGSVRSTVGISAVQGLRQSADLLHKFGGHPGAAGFSLAGEQFEAFRSRIHEYVGQFPTPVRTTRLDAPLPLLAFTQDLIDQTQPFAPFGEGIPAPLWLLRGDLTKPRSVGKTGTTLQFQVGHLRGVKYSQPSVPEGVYDFAAYPTLNEYRGNVSVELWTEALRPAHCVEMTADLPTTAYVSVLRAAPKAALEAAAAHAAIYAEGKVAEHVEKKGRGHQLLALGQTLPTGASLLLLSLPPEAQLRDWLTGALRGGTVTFAFGPNTLADLASGLQPRHFAAPQNTALAEAAADAYRRWQWSEHYQVLSDKAWAASVLSMLGLNLEAAASVSAPVSAAATGEH